MFTITKLYRYDHSTSGVIEYTITKATKLRLWLSPQPYRGFKTITKDEVGSRYFLTPKEAGINYIRKSLLIGALDLRNALLNIREANTLLEKYNLSVYQL